MSMTMSLYTLPQEHSSGVMLAVLHVRMQDAQGMQEACKEAHMPSFSLAATWEYALEQEGKGKIARSLVSIMTTLWLCDQSDGRP